MPYIPSASELLNPKEILERAGIRQGMRAADMGCGSQGHFVFPAAQMVGKSGKVWAVDILKPALNSTESRARFENATNVEPVWSDIEVYRGTKIHEASLDLVMLVNNLPKAAMIKETVRLVKPGGKLLVVDWKLTEAPFGPPSKDRRDPAAIKTDVAALGLRLVDEFEAGQYHYGLVFVK